jgi:hypothetical protein
LRIGAGALLSLPGGLRGPPILQFGSLCHRTVEFRLMMGLESSGGFRFFLAAASAGFDERRGKSIEAQHTPVE